MTGFHSTTAANNAARTYEHISVRPLAGSLGAEVDGIDVTDLGDAAMNELRQASDDHLVVFLRDQTLNETQLEDFTTRWGEFGEDPFVEGLPEHPHVVRLLKEADEAVPVVFGGAWHSDWSFQAEPPAYTILYALDVPEYGGDTLWSNMYLPTQWLSQPFRDWLKTLDAVHSASFGYGPDAKHNEFIENMKIRYGADGTVFNHHPLIRVHPRAGREVLYVNSVYTTGIAGLRSEEAEPILTRLFDICTSPVYQCRFRWRPGSIAIWDNRCVQHLPLTDYHGSRREMWRTTVAGEAPVRPDGAARR